MNDKKIYKCKKMLNDLWYIIIYDRKHDLIRKICEK